jgi:Tfp pilus assembly protein PilX
MAPRSQRGVSLIIAMLMLVIIGLVSAAVIRNATSADRAVTNNRVQTQASQFAQLALRFCEDQVQLSTSHNQVANFTVTTPPTGTTAWTVKDNWFNAKITYTLTSSDITSTVQPAHYPQCIAETAASPLSTYTVTARGFSDDWAEDATSHATTKGSVVWLQSTVHM